MVGRSTLLIICNATLKKKITNYRLWSSKLDIFFYVWKWLVITIKI